MINRSQKRFTLKETIDLYNSIGLKSRNMIFLTGWIYKISEKYSYLSNIPKKYRKILAEDKTKLTVFGILLDDLADHYELRNRSMLLDAIRIPFDSKNMPKNKYLEITRKIWKDIISSIETYPRYKDFEDIFYFDLDQFIDSIKYSYLINTSNIGNSFESKIYSPHNMMTFLFIDMDIMLIESFNKNELWKLRPIIYKVQDICHIGNILSTYSREMKEGDISPLLLRGLEKGIIKKEDIGHENKIIKSKLKKLEYYFKRRAEADFNYIAKHSTEIKSVDLQKYSQRVRKTYNEFLQRKKYWEDK